MTVCVDCKFANWKRTSNGRLHPDKSGKCEYVSTLSFPASMQQSGFVKRDNAKPMEIRGGYIFRDHDLGFCLTKIEGEPAREDE